MKQQRYRFLIYFIGITITITIAIQVYWNIQNYNTNKRRLMNEVQISLDTSVEAYYSDLAKTDIHSFAPNLKDISNEKKFWKGLKSNSEFLKYKRKNFKLLDTTKIIDSPKISSLNPNTISSIAIFRGENEVDSLNGLVNLTTKIVFAITRDSLNFQKLDSILQYELKRKNIAIAYSLKHFIDKDSTSYIFKKNSQEKLVFSTLSKSTYLPKNQKLLLQYSNPTINILKRSLTGISLSLLLSLSIIGCLFYLLYTIKKQKESAEIKNDLISNITHEFKTPITIVSTAIEAIKNFNQTNDKIKVETYLNISNQQLKKLHIMVEKLLETATLDSDKLKICTEDVDLVIMARNLTEKYQLFSPEKQILFSSNKIEITLPIDAFHFENALANLIDNAIKYGGSKIEVNLNTISDNVTISVVDNGKKIDATQSEKIFEKFYRIPTGNRHDVKGFGIGLFYARKIIEKHGGKLLLSNDYNTTVFKILL